jgi:alkylation response protein AidB-like acyl-CoA dehydrogenase
MAANFFLDNEDLKFQFDNVIAWKEIAELTEVGYTLPGGHANLEEAREFYRAVIEQVGELAGDFIAPRSLKIDHEGTRIEGGEVKLGKSITEVFEAIGERELFGMPVPRELGGSNCPLALFFVTGELFARADVSIMTHFGFHGGIAMSMLAYAAKEGKLTFKDGQITSTRWESAIRELAAGKAWGAMVLTEADAGSDLGRIRMRAEQRDGRWILNGEKIFITSGHGQYHFVLAKTDTSTGGDELAALKKLSLFLVPRTIERDGRTVENIQVTKVEEKMGHHGSPTCALNYENSEAELVGEVNQGFELMLMLMNNARVAVGFEAVGLCEAAFRLARDYAAQRKTMGQTIDRHPVVAEMLMDMQLDIAALRALNFEAANHVELSSKLELQLAMLPPSDAEEKKKLEKRLARHRRRARLLTPLVKYACAESAVRIARNGMQVHGGPGYITEVGAEKLLRDALVLPIYEGTSQIQALMALKDNMMLALRAPGPFARDAARAHILATTSATETERAFHRAEAAIYQSILAIVARIASGKLKRTIADKGWSEVGEFVKMSSWDPKTDFGQGLLHAERLARAMAHLECARALLDQAERFPQRRKLAERYMRRMAPRVGFDTDQILANDQSVFEWIAEIEP